MLRLKNENQVIKINEKISYLKNKKYIKEDRNARIKRKAREYVKACNMKNEKQVFNGVGNVNAVKHYAKRTPREWEKFDKKSVKSVEKAPIILIDDDEIIVEMGKIKTEKIYEKHLQEMDKEYEKIIVTLPEYKLKIGVEKIDLDEIPEKIKYNGEEGSREEIYKTIIGNNIKIFRAVEIL